MAKRGEVVTAGIVVLAEAAETPAKVIECTAFSAQRGVDFIVRITHGAVTSSAIGETFTDVGHELTDAGQDFIRRGSPFTEVAEEKNSLASRPLSGGAPSSCSGLEGLLLVRTTIASPRGRWTPHEGGAPEGQFSRVVARRTAKRAAPTPAPTTSRSASPPSRRVGTGLAD